MPNYDKAHYDSTWDIDQVYIEGEVDLAVTTGGTNSTTVNIPNLTNPVVEVTWKGGGETVWHQAFIPAFVSNFADFQIGPTKIYPNTTDTTNSANAWWEVLNNTLTIHVTSAGYDQTVTVRYYIWGDTIIQ